MRVSPDMQQQLQQLLFAAAPGLGEPPVLSQYIILSLGVFLGNIAMGICGFGTAIIHLMIWVLAQALGYNSGPLPVAVICCSCAMTIGMVPLFFLAKARTHAIRPLAMSIPVFKAISAPFGALMLKLLPARQLEGVVSVVMVVMIVLINKRKVQAAFARVGNFWAPPAAAAAGAAAVPAASGRPVKQVGKDVHMIREAQLDQQSYDQQGDTQLGLPTAKQGPGADDADEITSTSSSDSDTDDIDDVSSSSSSDEDADRGIRQPLLGAQLHHSEHAVILVEEADTDISDSDRILVPVGSSSNAAESGITQEIGFWGLYAIGSVTGLCTGLLGGATGIAGPPMMIMYAYLQVSKEAVRGTNAVMSLVQDQWIGYYLFGLLQWSDVYLYLAAAAAGATGMLIGHSVQKMMDQRHFNAVMSVLMGTCCVLMCSAAAGWITLASE